MIVPLALPLARAEDRRGFEPSALRVARLAQLPAALLVLASFLLPASPAAAALSAPWLLVALLFAAHGAGRLLARGVGPIEELACDAALLHLPVGAAWLVASRAGASPLGFEEPIVLLTAIHFHYAAFGALLAVAGLGRATLPSPRSERAFTLAAAGLVAGPMTLALGIAFSRALEAAAALLVAAGLVGALASALVATLPRARNRRLPVALLATSLLAAVATMGMAATFALAPLAGASPLDLATMARVHGGLNALVVVPLALVAARLLPAQARAPRLGMPVSRLASRLRTGPDFFERVGAIDAAREPKPRGLVDDVSEHARVGYDPTTMHPAIRAFYERTGDFALVVAPDWSPAFRALGRLYARYAERAGQMRLPLEAAGHGRGVRSVILPVKDAVDGRVGVRAWVRTYEDTGDPVYVAAYATHRERGVAYMNIAFPFPGWNLTSVLRMDAMDGDAASVVLTTRATAATRGDQGIFAVRAGRKLRLPMNEEIRVWAPGAPRAPFGWSDAPAGAILARHEIWALGLRVLTLDYRIRPRA